MAEYIERGVFIKSVKDIPMWGSVAAMLADSIPAADVAPVVRGRWEWLGPNRLVTDCMCGTCSACKVRSKYIVNTMLCPNCGAHMDGGDSDAGL